MADVSKIEVCTNCTEVTVYDVKDKTARQDIAKLQEDMVEFEQEVNNKVTNIENRVDKILTGTLKVNRLCRYLTDIGISTMSVFCNAQGFTETPTDYVIALIPNATAQNGHSNVVKLMIVDKTNFKIKRQAEIANAGHANSLAYYDNKLYIAVNSRYINGVNTVVNEIMILDYNSLTLLESWSPGVAHRVQSICFDSDRIWIAGQNQISEFTLTRNFVKTNTLSNSGALENNTDFDGAGTYQVIKHFRNMFIMVRFYPNCLIAYDDKTLELCGQLAMPVAYNDMYPMGELEDISISENGDIITLSTGQLNPTGTKVQVSLGRSNIYTNSYAGYTLGSKWTIGEPMTLYVAESGKNNPLANGSQSKPFGEIQEAVNCIMKAPNGNGYTVDVQGGTYDNVVVQNMANPITITSDEDKRYYINDLSVRSCFLRMFNGYITGNTTYKQPSTDNLVECTNANLYLSNVDIGSSAKKFTTGIDITNGSVVHGQDVVFTNLTQAVDLGNSTALINAPTFNSCDYHYKADTNSLVECGDNSTEFISPQSAQAGNPVKPWRLIADGLNLYGVGTTSIDTKGNYFRVFAIELSGVNNTGTHLEFVRNNVASRVSSVASSTSYLYIGHMNVTVDSNSITIHGNYRYTQSASSGAISVSSSPDDTFVKIKSVWGIK